jgi:hypothetical protein
VTGTAVVSAANPGVSTIVGPATASCTSGKVLVGGGGEITGQGATQYAAISSSFPSAGGANGTWSVSAIVLASKTGLTTTVTPFALCAG